VKTRSGEIGTEVEPACNGHIGDQNYISNNLGTIATQDSELYYATNEVVMPARLSFSKSADEEVYLRRVIAPALHKFQTICSPVKLTEAVWLTFQHVTISTGCSEIVTYFGRLGGRCLAALGLYSLSSNRIKVGDTIVA
jgi:hypothetical protein